jgi:hypothetical protein
MTNEPIPGLKTHLTILVNGILAVLVSRGVISTETPIEEWTTTIVFFALMGVGMFCRHLGNRREQRLKDQLNGKVTL